MLCAANVGKDEDCRRLAQTCVDEFGAIHFLVNNAGYTKFVAHDDLEGLTPEDFLDIYRINVVGAYTMVRACAPEMKKHGKGSVVNSGSCVVVWRQDGERWNKPVFDSLLARRCHGDRLLRCLRSLQG